MSILSTRRVYLDHVRPNDFGWVYDLLVSPDAGPIFQFGGRIPSPAEVQQRFWEDMLAHWVVAGVHDHRRRGLVTLGSADLVNGYGYVSFVATPETRRSGLLMEGLGLAVDYAFRTWPFRKLYAEVCEPSLKAFRRVVGRFVVEEGRLREHRFRDGAFRDVITFAMYRQHWEAMVRDFGHLRPPLVPTPPAARFSSEGR